VNFDDYDLLDFLNTVPNAITVLKEKYSMLVKEKDDRILFKYHQIDTPKCHLTNQCRGVIISADRPHKYVCRGFYRFFNYGEAYVAPVDWGTAKVQEKVDGSLIRIYHHNDSLCIATSGNIDAFDSPLQTPCLDKNLYSYGDLVQQILPYTMYEVDKNTTYLFELTSPYNRVVVPHKEIKLTFLASIQNDTGEESFVNNTELPSVRSFIFSARNVIEMAEHLPFTEEGYVVVDDKFNRIKVKSPAYLAVHRLKGESYPTVRRVVELIESGETEEFLSYFSEYKDMFSTVRDAIETYCIALDNAYDFVMSNSIERKDIATIMGKYSGYVFNRLDKRVDNSVEYIMGMPVKKKEEIIQNIIKEKQ